MSNLSELNLQSILEKRKRELLEEITVSYKQLGFPLTEVDKLRLQRQINGLESELQSLEEKIHLQTNLPKTPTLITYNLPERNRFFTGREDTLNQLKELLLANKETPIKQAIAGLGGIGKTQTAIEYCYRNISAYQTILWVNSQNKIDLNNSYLGMAKSLNTMLEQDIQTEVNNKKVIEMVITWLASNSNWLIILDNLEDPNLVRSYLPNNGQGHILITTQIDDLGTFANTISLEKMDVTTGSLLLLRRAKLLEENHLLDKADSENIKFAKELAKEMGGLPLALDQAAAYVLHSKCSLQRYLSLYKDARYAAKLRNKRGKYTDNHVSVFATFKLAFDKVEEKSPVAANLLKPCSFLFSDFIPEEIFTKANKFFKNELKTLDDKLIWDETLEILLNYSLIKRDANNQSFSIHRLVQAVIRDFLNLNEQIPCLQQLLKALASFCSCDAQDLNNWPQYQRILSTTLSLVSLVDTNPDFPSDIFSFNEASTLFNKLGIYSDTQALYTQALYFFERGLPIAKSQTGDSPTSAGILNNIGLIYDRKGNYNKALDFYNQALSINIFTVGKNHPDTAITLTNIGLTHDNRREYNKALDFHYQALSIKLSTLKYNDPSIALSLNNIANTYYNQRKYDAALDIYNQTLSIKLSTLGEYHPDTALTVNNIGSVYRKQGKYNQALDFYYRALFIKLYILGEHHPDTIDTLNNIGSICERQENYDLALDIYKQVLSVYKLKLGQNHFLTVATISNMASVYEKQGNYDEALTLSLEALSMKKSILPMGDPSTILSLNNVAKAYYRKGAHDKALNHLYEALSIKKYAVPIDHPIIADTLNSIGVVYLALKNYEKALDFYQQALSVKKSLIPIDSFSVTNSLLNIATLYHTQCNYAKAEENYKEIIKITEKDLETNYPTIAQVLEHLAHVCQDTNRYIEAADYYDEALTVFRRFLPHNHPYIIQLLQAYSTLLGQLGRLDEVEILQKTINNLKNPSHEDN